MKIAVLFLAMLLGIIIPQGHVGAFLIRYFLMIMLFFAFLDIQIKRDIIRLTHMWVLIANFLIAIIAYITVDFTYPLLASSAFICGIMPTGVAATVMIGFLKGETEYVVFAVLLTNIMIALCLPFILPFVVATQTPIQTQDVILPVFTVVLLPLFVALSLRRISPRLQRKLLPYRAYTFYLFTTNVYLATARASHFVRNDLEASWSIVVYIALMTLGICIVNFFTGNWIGLPYLRIEGQQALGRKNTMFGIWVALTFINPLAAMGPVFYILYQNLFNAYQMWRIKT